MQRSTPSGWICLCYYVYLFVERERLTVFVPSCLIRGLSRRHLPLAAIESGCTGPTLEILRISRPNSRRKLMIFFKLCTLAADRVISFVKKDRFSCLMVRFTGGANTSIIARCSGL